FPRIRLDPIAMAGAGLSGSERGHQPERIGGTPRRGADHAFAHPGQARGLRTDRTTSASVRPARLDPPACAGSPAKADAGAQARRDSPQRGVDRSIRGGGFAPAGNPEDFEIQSYRSARRFGGKAEASKSWLVPAK